jgi:hypothetical protein
MATHQDSAIYALLTGDSTLTALLYSNTSVWKNHAPPGSAMPYVIYAESGGGPDNRFAGSHEDVTFSIKCVADNDANGALIAETAAARIGAIFNRPASVTMGDSWVERATTVTGQFSYAETMEKKTYTHAGRIIRLRADK